VLCKGYKIVNDLTLSNQDGTDPDFDKNMVIDDIFEYTSDDAVAVKADSGLSDGLIVKNSVFWTKKSALKIGTGIQHGASNIWFIHNDVLHADRAIAVYATTGTANGIHYIENTSEDIGGNAQQQLVVIEADAGAISNVEVVDYVAFRNGPKSSTIVNASNIRFCNLKIAGQFITSPAAGNFVLTNAKNVTFTSCTSATPVPRNPFSSDGSVPAPSSPHSGGSNTSLIRSFLQLLIKIISFSLLRISW
jgi:hypothetical protein